MKDAIKGLAGALGSAVSLAEYTLVGALDIAGLAAESLIDAAQAAIKATLGTIRKALAGLSK